MLHILTQLNCQGLNRRGFITHTCQAITINTINTIDNHIITMIVMIMTIVIIIVITIIIINSSSSPYDHYV